MQFSFKPRIHGVKHNLVLVQKLLKKLVISGRSPLGRSWFYFLNASLIKKKLNSYLKA